MLSETKFQSFEDWLKEAEPKLRADFDSRLDDLKKKEREFEKKAFIDSSVLSIPAVHLRYVDADYMAKQVKMFFDAGYDIDDLLDCKEQGRVANPLASQYWPAWTVFHEKLISLGWTRGNDIYHFLREKYT